MTRVVLVALFALAGSGSSAAQPPRSGLWIESGVGTGTARIGCAGCTDVTVAYGSSSFLRFGGAVGRRVLLGVEIFAFNDKSVVVPGQTAEPVDAESASIGAIVLWYPGGTGVFLRGGLGVARGTFTVAPPAGQRVTTTSTGSGLSFGGGMDLPLLSWFALTANLTAYVSAIGDVTLPGGTIDDVIATTYHASLGLTIR